MPRRRVLRGELTPLKLQPFFRGKLLGISVVRCFFLERSDRVKGAIYTHVANSI